MFILKPLIDKNESIPLCEGAGEQHSIESVLSEESIFKRRPVWHVPRKNSILQQFIKRNGKKDRLKNSVKLPRDRIIPSSAIKFNSLVSCV